ncbi:MAG: PIN domain-containing protein [Bryobacteraceae bacterium]|jgi:predicted nucleic acid-binding protein
MSVEFVDTNILVYAHDGAAGAKHDRSVELLRRLLEEGSGALSIQVLAEFYVTATKKLGMSSQEAEEVLLDLGGWIIHRPTHADLLRAVRLHRRHGVSWWDALILNSAAELGCRVLWTEDISDGQRYGSVTARNPFRA